MDRNTPPPTKVVDEKLVESSSNVTKILYKDANGELETFISKLLNEKGEGKDNSFSILVGLSKTGLMGVEHLVTSISRIPATEKDRRSILVESYLKSNPDDSSCIQLMDAVKESDPELIASVISAKKDWTLKDIRRHISKYMFSEKLWFRLAEMQEELLSRS